MRGFDGGVVFSVFGVFEMTVEDIKAKQERAHARLKRIEEGVDHATMADAYEYAFDLVDDALNAALKIIERPSRLDLSS